MTNEKLVTMLHSLADKVGELLDKPVVEGSMPLISVTINPDNKDEPVLKLIVGVEFVEGEEVEGLDISFNGG